jgi:hypothetical protein
MGNNKPIISRNEGKNNIPRIGYHIKNNDFHHKVPEKGLTSVTEPVCALSLFCLLLIIYFF